MKLSVLLTTYNHERFIEQAIDSVLMQETNFDFEIVIMEDCSTDSTRDLVIDYHRQHRDLIRLILSEENKNDNTNFATAWQTSPSQYIATLDGDDYWTSPRKLQKQVDFLDQHPECAICFHDAAIIHEDCREERNQAQDSNSTSWTYTPGHMKEISALEDLLTHNFIAGCSPMLRRELLKQLPGWYANAAWGDWPLYILSAQHGKIGHINEILGVYRLHSGGYWSGLSTIHKLEAIIAFLESIVDTLDIRYAEIIQTAISDYRKKLTLEKTRAAAAQARFEWQKKGISDQQLVQRVRQTVRSALPQHSPVTVVTKDNDDLLKLDNRRVWPFQPKEGTRVEQLFTQGAKGSQEAPWINAGHTYEFRLYSGTERERLLASVEVTRSDEAFIAATPNPVPTGPGQGTTTIDWSTGDDLEGQVYLTAYKADDGYYPVDSYEAIAQLERLRDKGVAFLVFPPTAFWWLDHYSEFERHLENHYRAIARREDACLIYALQDAQGAISGVER
jgi:glycosyltransferase involved in cell wall biosynthesis